MLHIAKGDLKMEQYGIIKKLDKLNRIVIPKEMRKRFSLDQEVELIVTKDGILLRNPRASESNES